MPPKLLKPYVLEAIALLILVSAVLNAIYLVMHTHDKHDFREDYRIKIRVPVLAPNEREDFAETAVLICSSPKSDLTQQGCKLQTYSQHSVVTPEELTDD